MKQALLLAVMFTSAVISLTFISEVSRDTATRLAVAASAGHSADIPEPVTLVLCGISMMAIGFMRRFPEDLT